MANHVSKTCISGFKPKHQVGKITLLGKLNSASIWYPVSVNSIVLKYFRFKIVYLF